MKKDFDIDVGSHIIILISQIPGQIDGYFNTIYDPISKYDCIYIPVYILTQLSGLPSATLRTCWSVPVKYKTITFNVYM